MIDKINFHYISGNGEWKETVKTITDELMERQIVNADYYSALLNEINHLGPYFVIAKDIALIHIAPGGTNLKTNLSLNILENEVHFSEEERHTAKFLFVLNALDGNSHMDIMMKFAQTFSNKDFVREMYTIKSFDDYQTIYKKYFNE